MKKLKRKEKYVGNFEIEGSNYAGELTLDKKKTNLHIESKTPFQLKTNAKFDVRGILNDGTKLSLLQCLSPGTGTISNKNASRYFADIFPHHVVYGEQYISATEKSIKSISFSISDATVLFHDVDAFGELHEPIADKSIIEQIVKVRSEKFSREIKTGPDWYLTYFSGAKEIVKTQTDLGQIIVAHNPSYPCTGPHGSKISNTIFIKIVFDTLTTFENALSSTFVLLRFFDVVIGRKQYVKFQGIRLIDDKTYLHVYSTMKPKQKPVQRDPHFCDLIVDPIRDNSEFCTVLKSWVSLDAPRLDARVRFSRCFTKANSLTPDRLIAAANMFDILPSEAVPQAVQLANDLKVAHEQSKKVWKSLPYSAERDSVLGALGRIGKPSLRQKINHRISLINSSKVIFPDLEFVVNKAVTCRNHYVHGSEGDFDYTKNFDAVFFFVETLEMVFAISEFVESGWNIDKWCANGTVMSHPFAAYRVNYKLNLDKLRKLIAKSENQSKSIQAAT